MPVEIYIFLKNYSSAVVDDSAALFIGAGMSRKLGFVDWKGFLTPLALELGITITPDTDLVALAQYYINSKNGERSFLNDALLDEFDRPGKFERNHEIIAKLPITTIWTTNYDELIEYAFMAARKYLDVKIRDKDIGFSRRECVAVLYKMHGDISQPDKVIITNEDYERYPRTHPVFQHTLTTALLTKTFLFLGLSFDDPNLHYTLGHLCALLENKKRVHYVVLRNVRRLGKLSESGTVLTYTESRADYEDKKKKQGLRIADLHRYGIETILIDCFRQITGILALLDLRLSLRKQYPALSEGHLDGILKNNASKLLSPCQRCQSIRQGVDPDAS